MSVKFLKTGVVQASGEIGTNLLLHTDTAAYGIGYLSPYSSGTVTIDNTMIFNNRPAIKIKPSSSSTSSGASTNYNGDKVVLTAGVKYCYSAWVYTDVADTWSHGSLGHFQTYAGSAAHNVTIHYQNKEIPANKWTWVYQIFTPTADCKFRSYHIYFANTSQTLWIAEVKLEQNDHPTLWVPNVNDSDYVGSLSGFNEYNGVAQITKGQVNATDFIEI